MTDSTSPGDPVEVACALYEQATTAHAAGDADTARTLFGQACVSLRRPKALPP